MRTGAALRSLFSPDLRSRFPPAFSLLSPSAWSSVPLAASAGASPWAVLSGSVAACASPLGGPSSAPVAGASAHAGSEDIREGAAAEARSTRRGIRYFTLPILHKEVL